MVASIFVHALRLGPWTASSPLAEHAVWLSPGRLALAAASMITAASPRATPELARRHSVHCAAARLASCCLRLVACVEGDAQAKEALAIRPSATARASSTMRLVFDPLFAVRFVIGHFGGSSPDLRLQANYPNTQCGFGPRWARLEQAGLDSAVLATPAEFRSGTARPIPGLGSLAVAAAFGARAVHPPGQFCTLGVVALRRPALVPIRRRLRTASLGLLVVFWHGARSMPALGIVGIGPDKP